MVKDFSPAWRAAVVEWTVLSALRVPLRSAGVRSRIGWDGRRPFLRARRPGHSPGVEVHPRRLLGGGFVLVVDEDLSAQCPAREVRALLGLVVWKTSVPSMSAGSFPEPGAGGGARAAADE